jgi:hypothetical protein
MQPRPSLRDSWNSESGRLAHASLGCTPHAHVRRTGSMARSRPNTNKTCVHQRDVPSFVVFDQHLWCEGKHPKQRGDNETDTAKRQFPHPSGITLCGTSCPHAAATCVKLLPSVPTSSPISDRIRISTIAFCSDSSDPRSASL